MILLIRHTTRHRYDMPVSFSEHSLYLRPIDSYLCSVDAFEIKTQPESSQRWVRDQFGNAVLKCFFGLATSDLLEFVMEARVHVQDSNPFDFVLDDYATAYPFKYKDEDLLTLSAYVNEGRAEYGSQCLDWFYHRVPSPLQHKDVIQFLLDINMAIKDNIAYEVRLEEGIQSPNTTLDLGRGSCRDLAVLFIAITRQLGFAARFVSGYLFDPPEGDSGGHMYGRAVGSMHAWAEVYLPGAGWKGFDPTNGILANQNFVATATALNPSAVDPIQGSYYSDTILQSKMEVELEVLEQVL